jgi:2-polyprenyl-6-hydroxyphenyl methylase/3-demethylubiquinone-9 3-methyltransferase
MQNTYNQVISEERFEFGKNWRSILSTLSQERIDEAKRSLLDLLKIENLNGKKFLDIGSGSGLFSLAARQLGAEVYSFDYDPESVTCARLLREKYANDDKGTWHIEQGSILDDEYIGKLGTFDVVYSWGVLHHTGNMWQAIQNFDKLVAPGGYACIAIYNDQGIVSRIWRGVKRTFCSSFPGKALVCAVFFPYFFLRVLASSVIRKKNQFAEYKKNRGMSIIHDWLDWLGGYPFEVASVHEVFTFFSNQNYTLVNIYASNTLGNNEFTFVKNRTS